MDTHRGRQVAARPGPRLDAGHRRRRAHPRAGERAGLLLRPQPGRHASTRRPSPGRPSTARCTRATSPASRSSTGWPSRSGRAASSGWRNTARVALIRIDATARARRRAADRHAHRRVRASCRRRRCCSPPAAGRPCTSTTRPRATRAATAWRWRCAPACRCATWRWCSSTRPACSPAPHTRMTGTVLEEGLRGAGGYLLDGDGQRFMHELRPARRARDARHRLARDLRRDARRPHHARTAACGISMAHLGPGQRAPPVQGHGRALRRLRLRPRRRPGRGGADRALHDGRRGVRAGLHAPSWPGCSSPARTPAACMAPTAWAATAWRTPPCSAASPATRWRAAMRGGRAWREPDEGALAAAIARARRPLEGSGASPPSELAQLRERLYERCGRTRASSATRRGCPRRRRARRAGRRWRRSGCPPRSATRPSTSPGTTGSTSRTWSRSRAPSWPRPRGPEDSRGAHFRDDFPATGDLATSSYLRVRSGADGTPALSEVPVAFTRVRPDDPPAIR